MNGSDHYIAVYDNLSAGSENILPWLKALDLKFIFADMKDNSSLEKTVRTGNDAIIHLARTLSWLSDGYDYQD